MRKYIAIAFVFILTASCSSREDKLRKPIEDLSTQWVSLADQITVLNSEIDKELKTWEGMYEGMYISEEIVDTLSQETKETINQLKLQCLGHGDIYYNIKSEVKNTLMDIDLESERIQELMLGLDRHQLPDSAEMKIENLQGLISKVAFDLDQVSSKLDSTKSQCVITCSKYAKLIVD